MSGRRAALRTRLLVWRERLRAWARHRLPPLWARHRRHVLAAAAALVLALVWWFDRFARLHVVNTLADPVELRIDGRARAWLLPITSETPEAGVELRLRPGFHHIALVAPSGATVEELDGNLPPHSRYLFAPSDGDQCFWVEHTAYGQALPTLPPSRPLPPEQRLWALPDEVDAWFFPTPPASSDRRSSGGTRTAVRQARCGFEPWR